LFLDKQPGYKRLNCTQAIAQTFKEKYSFITDQTITDFKKRGFGKAPNKECGMFYAAKYIFENNGQLEKVKEFELYFKGIASSTQCSDIIKKKIVFCADCINKTSEFINKKNKE